MPNRETRFSILLAALVLLTVVGPPLAEGGYGGVALSTIFAGVLVAGALVVGERGRVRTASIVLVGLALAAEVFTLSTGGAHFVVAARSFSALFLAFATVTIVVRIVQEEDVTVDTILGGCCVYLLLAVLFAAVYALVEYLMPGSYRVAGHALQEPAGGRGLGRYPELVYFSLGTLTTLGYGDVVPERPLARSLSGIEAASGQLFLAILIARLVGLHLHGRRRGPGA